MKRILTVVGNLRKGGTQRAAQVFAEAYKELNCDSRVLCLYNTGIRHDELLDNNIKVYLNLEDSKKELLEWNPDIIHIHSHMSKINELKNLKKLFPKKIFAETNVFSIPSAWGDIIDNSFQLSNWAGWLFNLKNINNYHSSVVPYPINPENFKITSKLSIDNFKKDNNIPLDSKIIGRIGQSSYTKWSNSIVNVFERLASSDKKLYLVIVNAPREIIDKCLKSKYSDRIRIIDKIIGDENLSICYSAFDLMLLIAIQGESFGMVLAESILCETPVVTLSTPWADNSQGEVVKNGIGGFVAHTKKGLIKATKLILDGNSNLNMKTARDSIIKRYYYVEVAKKALNNLENKTHKQKDINIINLLEDSFDKPNIITKFLLRTNTNLGRRLTIIFSGFIFWGDLKIILKKFFFKK